MATPVTPHDHDAYMTTLNHLFGRLFHSAARYMVSAEPYVPTGAEPLLARVRQVAERDQDRARTVARVIEALEGVPQLEPFDEGLADMNYLSIKYLAGQLDERLDALTRDVEAARARGESLGLARQVAPLSLVAQSLGQDACELREALAPPPEPEPEPAAEPASDTPPTPPEGET